MQFWANPTDIGKFVFLEEVKNCLSHSRESERFFSVFNAVSVYVGGWVCTDWAGNSEDSTYLREWKWHTHFCSPSPVCAQHLVSAKPTRVALLAIVSEGGQGVILGFRASGHQRLCFWPWKTKLRWLFGFPTLMTSTGSWAGGVVFIDVFSWGWAWGGNGEGTQEETHGWSTKLSWALC